jgi:hypothetical protein
MNQLLLADSQDQAPPTLALGPLSLAPDDPNAPPIYLTDQQ